MQILQEYPILPTTLDDIPNEALGLFLRANISGQVKSILTGTSSENGLAILHRLQKMYASATMELFIGLAMLLPLSALAIQAREAESDNDHCDFL